MFAEHTFLFCTFYQSLKVTKFSIFHALRYIRLIVAEALRLYPQPPLLIRRSLRSDVLPGIFSG